MFYHKLKERKVEDKVEYEIELVKRKYFRDKTLFKVVDRITDQVAAKNLVVLLDETLKTGIKLANLNRKEV